ncbi:MAG: ankyrin repeat domain-containing protein, partial [Bacillota bacterium]
MAREFEDALDELAATVLICLVGYGYSFSEHELINPIDCLMKNHCAEILETNQDEFLKRLQATVERINNMDVELLQRKIVSWDLHVDSYIEENESVRSVLALLKIADYRGALDEYLGMISRIIYERGVQGLGLQVCLEEETAELGKFTYNFWLLHRDSGLECESVEKIYELALKAQILLDAIKNNDIEGFKLMVESGAYIYMKNYLHGNLLHYACSCNCSYAMMQYLIGLGLDVNLRDCCFYTPLHEAFSRWQEV